MTEEKTAVAVCSGRAALSGLFCGIPFEWVEQMMKQHKREKLAVCMAATFLWGMVAYGYRFCNLDFSHDSMLVFQELDVGPMISVGRFLQPVYFWLRGRLYAPMLVGCLALCYIGLSVYWVAELLELERRGTIGLLSGVMAVNSVVTLTGATYLHNLDIYMLALLLAVWSVWICRRGKYGFLLAVFPRIASLGLYQSYLQTAILLHMMLLVLALLRQEDTSEIIAEGRRALVSFALALAIYYGCYRLALVWTGTAVSTNYNALSNVGLWTAPGKLLRDLAYGAYTVFRFFAVPAASCPGVVAVCYGGIFFAAAVSVAEIVRLRGIRGRELALLAVLLGAMPFAMNLACILAQGMVHDLMLYVCVLLLVLAWECSRLWREVGQSSLRWLGRRLLPLLLGVVVLDGVIYANQVSLKKTLEYNATMTTMNRILDRIELTEGYVYGQTPVAFVGLLYNSPLTRQAADFDYSRTGLWHSYAVSFPETYGMYIQNVLNYDMRILSADEAEELADREIVRHMGIFPARDSVQMVDGVAVVKLAGE